MHEWQHTISELKKTGVYVKLSLLGISISFEPYTIEFIELELESLIGTSLSVPKVNCNSNTEYNDNNNSNCNYNSSWKRLAIATKAIKAARGAFGGSQHSVEGEI